MDSSSKNSPGTYQYVIVGAGPAGLQMGYFLKRAGRNYVILEASDVPGSFFRTNPVHRTLISINKRFNPFPEHEYNMRHDWNSLLSDDRDLLFTKYSKELFPSADDLVRYVNDFASKLKINIKYNTRVKEISKYKGNEPNVNFKILTTEGAVYKAEVMLVATGAVSERIPDEIKGKEHLETYGTHDVDPEKYEGKSVCIIGNGNSAFEAANNLAGHASLVHIFGDRKLKYAWETHFVGDLRAINNTILDMYQLKSLAVYVALLLQSVEKTPEGKYLCTFKDVVAHWEKKQGYYFLRPPAYDHVICCTGFNYVDLSIFAEDCKPETKAGGKFPKLSNTWESSIPNMYFMGTSMQCIDRKAASGFIHGFRYNIRTLSNFLNEKYNDVPYPTVKVDMNVDAIAKRIINRVSLGDSIYQMNDFLIHVVGIPDFEPGKEDMVKAHFYEDLPKPYVFESRRFFDKYKHVLVIKLVYGFDEFEKIAVANDFVHTPDFEVGRCHAFLHPRVAHYLNGEYQSQTLLHESFVLRYDVPGFLDQNPDINLNLLRNFVNKILKLEPGKEWNASFFGSKELFESRVFPFTEEEKKRVPDLSGYNACIPYSIDLMPR
ncbi:FAD-dependent oxidoreductase domain-containing protein 2-like isoform X1 [Ptychodera flava]|uniref:FAD-dependent oxidoreductase domain-containing protein 2-like isoform X1 n=1 Tax=Ptychodera flava TaxID=63121 RepID=UPI00396A8D5E